jgi:PAS domain S-box-containing protein
MQPLPPGVDPPWRSQAEALAGPRSDAAHAAGDPNPKLIHELQVHQIELQLQNEFLRAAQAELTTARDRLAMFFNKTPIGYVILDESGVILESNETFCQMVQSPASGLREKAFASFLAESQRATFLGRYRALFQQPANKHLESALIGPKGELRSISIEGTVVPQADPTRSGHGLLLSISDITTLKRLESQLFQAQKMEAIGQLAGGVAHDFNNILAAILLQLGMIRMNPEVSSEIRKELEGIVHEANRAAHLTRQLLMFSRRSVIQAKRIDLADVIGNMVRMLRRLIGESIALDWRVKEIPAVEADPGLIEQVVLNLCLNARDAMGTSGTLTLAVASVHFNAAAQQQYPERRTGDFVRLTVSDTGCGMDEATLKRAFEPFFTTKEVGKGTGLGLATVHGIVSQHKGWVEVASTPGCGSSFDVYLPAAHDGPAPVRSQEEGTLARGHETILLVEDEPVVRNTFAKCLRFLGYQVIEAQTGTEAIEVWKERGDSVDLILSDMAMPGGMSGLDLVEHLRRERPGLRAVISSGYSTAFLRQDPSTRADIVFLAKPFEPAILAAAVRRSLDAPLPPPAATA